MGTDISTTSVSYPMAALEMMGELCDREMTPSEAARYLYAFGQLSSEIGMKIAYGYVFGTYLPKDRRNRLPMPQEILDIAIDLEYPSPDPHAAFGEVAKKIRRFGTAGKILDACRPNIRVEGTPDFSHPAIAFAVRSLGGWKAICLGEAGEGSYLQNSFLKAYEEARRIYTQEVKENLLLPAAQRYKSLLAGRSPEMTISKMLRASQEQQEALPQGGVNPDMVDLHNLKAKVRGESKRWRQTGKRMTPQEEAKIIDTTFEAMEHVGRDMPPIKAAKKADAPSQEELARRQMLRGQAKKMGLTRHEI